MASSYISNEDLDALTLSSQSTKTSTFDLTGSKSLSPDRGVGCRKAKVAFCPLALLINCAGAGEKEDIVKPVLEGKPKLCMRTYSLDRTNLQRNTTKAWSKVVSSFSSSLQPILAPNSCSGHGVAAFSAPRSSSPPRHCPVNDSRFEPQQCPQMINIRLPSFARRPVRSRSLDAESTRGILKSPESKNVPLPLPSPPLESPTSPSLSTTVTSTFSSSPISPTVLASPAHLSRLATIPICDCCLKCSEAAEQGQKEEWTEHWSKSARRKRKRDLRIMREYGMSDDIAAPPPECVETPGEEEKNVPLCTGSGLAKAHVDELACIDESEEGEPISNSECPSDEETLAEDATPVNGVPVVSEEVPTSQEMSETVSCSGSASSAESEPVPRTPSPALKPEVYEPSATTATKNATVPKQKRKFSLTRLGSGLVEAGMARALATASTPGRGVI